MFDVAFIALVVPQLDLLPALSVTRSRAQGKTYYVSAEGARFPSVTTILNATKPQEDREALARWQARVGVAEASRISRSASRRGTQTHRYIRHYLLGDESARPDAIAPYWRSLEPVLQAIETVRLVEGTVLHADLGYAGRVDCVARYQGELCLLDWKTADQPKGSVERLYDAPLQLAAYCGAVNQTYAAYGVQLRHALVVVAIADQPAELFWFEPDDLLDYWQTWTERLARFQRRFG